MASDLVDRPAPRRAGTGSLARMPGLDGVRAVAVAAVLLFHANPSWLPGGFLGVDVFFTLSGFLITSLLLAELDARGGIRFGRFYQHRAKRLLPAMFLVLLATSLLAMTVAQDAAARVREDVIASAALRDELVVRRARHVVLRRHRPPSPAAAPVVAGGRGAVLPGLAADPVRAVAHRQGGGCARRRDDRGARLHGLDGLDRGPRRHPRRGRLRPGLLRHRHPRHDPAGGRRAGHLLDAGGRDLGPDRPRPASGQPHGPGVPGRSRPHLPVRRRVVVGALPRRLPLDRADHSGFRRGCRDQRHGLLARPVDPATALDRPAVLRHLPVALADLPGAAPRHRPRRHRLAGPSRPLRHHLRRSRAVLPLRRDADPPRSDRPPLGRLGRPQQPDQPRPGGPDHLHHRRPDDGARGRPHRRAPAHLPGRARRRDLGGGRLALGRRRRRGRSGSRDRSRDRSRNRSRGWW